MNAIRNESKSAGIEAQGNDLFGTHIVGKLLSIDELDQIGGGDIGVCGPGAPSYYQSGGGQYYQSGGSYTQSGGSYSMSC